jgi:hypothetical protein
MIKSKHFQLLVQDIVDLLAVNGGDLTQVIFTSKYSFELCQHGNLERKRGNIFH